MSILHFTIAMYIGDNDKYNSRRQWGRGWGRRENKTMNLKTPNIH